MKAERAYAQGQHDLVHEATMQPEFMESKAAVMPHLRKLGLVK